MEFKHIKEKACKCCLSGIRSKTISNCHTNGYWNEYVEFECGRKLHFSPNFMKIIVDKECPKEPKEVLKNGKRERFDEKLVKFIEDHNLIDDKEKIRVFESLKYSLLGAKEALKRLKNKD